MQKMIKPIDVIVGEAIDGHAELMEASLRESGNVNSLYRGRDGLETLALARQAWGGGKDAPDAASLILLDCDLPLMGGVRVLRDFRCDRRFSSVPIIMMTTTYSRQQAEQCRRLGCTDYVTKWAVFLGLRRFVRSLGLLAGETMRCASGSLTPEGLPEFGAGPLDPGSFFDAAKSYRRRPERRGKEVKDAPDTS